MPCEINTIIFSYIIMALKVKSCTTQCKKLLSSVFLCPTVQSAHSGHSAIHLWARR